MGQFSYPDRVTASWPNAEYGRVYPLDPLAATITLELTGGVHSAGTNANILKYLFWSPNDTGTPNTQIGTTGAAVSGLTSPQTFNYSTAGIPPGSFVFGGFGPNTSGNTLSETLTLYDDLTYCVYGAQRNSSAPGFFVWTYDIAYAVLTKVKSVAFAVLIGSVIGQVVDLGALCTTVRPPPIDLTAQDFLHFYGLGSPTEIQDAKTKVARWFLWAAWSYYCECVPGSPAPVTPPIISNPNPPGLPSDPSFTFACDNSDLCSQMLKLNVALTAVLQRLSSMEGTVNYIQRQGVPDTYAYGTVHSGLSASGDFGVANILGLAVDITTLPSAYPSFGGDPDTYHNLGKISVGTADGWERSWWATHDPYLVLPVSGAITKVGYSFPSGIVATITELVRTP